MIRSSAPFLLGIALVFLSSFSASADLPIRELINPAFLVGDPYEPEKSHVESGPSFDTTMTEEGTPTSTRTASLDFKRRSTSFVGRLFFSFRSVSWLIWLRA